MTFICKICNKEISEKEQYFSPFVNDQYERVHMECKDEFDEAFKLYLKYGQAELDENGYWRY